MTDIFERQAALVKINAGWLRQGVRVLDEMDDHAFAAAGGQFRHVIEFYECFLEGLGTNYVDYDSRRRDHTIQTSRAAASSRIVSLIGRLEAARELLGDRAIFVRVEDATGMNLPQPFLSSSIGRELMALSSHTVHHYALIAMILRAHGVTVDQLFGVAPSTLRHAARRAEAA